MTSVNVINPHMQLEEQVVEESVAFGEQNSLPKKKNSKCCASVKHLQFMVAFTAMIAVGLACGLGYVLYPTQDPMRRTPSEETTAKTRVHFSGGEEETDLITSVPTLTHLPKLSSDRFKRSDMIFDKKETNDVYTAGLTEMKDADGKVQYEMRTEVLAAGAATLGEYSDRHGQVGTKTIRLQITEKETGDRFFLIPIGLSTTSFDADEFDTTLIPDLYYFSYQKAGTSLDQKILSFCTTANDKPSTATCFLGHGQKEWDEHVQKWSKMYYENMLAEGTHSHLQSDRKLYDWGDAGSDAGGYVGGKVGGKVGGVVGGTVGGYVGGAIGGAVAGPVGVAIGEEVGHWAGAKVGSELGSKYGSEAGSNVGQSLGNDADTHHWRL